MRFSSQESSSSDTNDNDNDNVDDDWNGDAYWIQQIHKQGAERPEYQWFQHRSSLPFECTACGKCCKTQGNVYMTPEEHEAAAKLLDMSKEDFIQQYVSHTLEDKEGGLWIRLLDQSSSTSATPNNSQSNSADTNDNAIGHGCIFLQEDNTCRIYEARPIQCSTYPFWPNILTSQKAWNDEVCRAEDDDKHDNNSELPLWTLERGGCEGMQLVKTKDDEEEEHESSTEGVPTEQVYEQAYFYEHDERRFPRSKEIPVQRN